MNDGACAVSSFHGACVCWPDTCCSTRVLLSLAVLAMQEDAAVCVCDASSCHNS
jgi:hypothetical protein